MLYVRTVTTTSGATAVQVIRYQQRKRVIVKHIGSAHLPEELHSLRCTARLWIEHATAQQSLFPFEKKSESTLLPLDKLRNLGVRYSFAQETMRKLFHLFGFSQANRLLLDVVMMRIIQPASKRESLELLTDLFGITHHRADLYRTISTMTKWKESIERDVIAVAKTHFSFDFTIVFYDVTTVYFESFKEDEFKNVGFSKDNKSNQPQIVIGLIVTADGFPVSYQVFEGKTFEGKTFIPMISSFKETHAIKNLIVVADAAMISLDNVETLVEKKLSYIVGARVANLTRKQIIQISSQLSCVDQASIRIETTRGFLVCDFSQKRYEKEKREMDKQIAKAEKLLKEKNTMKRVKFLKNKGIAAHLLHTALIEKTKLLLGIKGYYTNLKNETNETIITHYHNLWHVELAFRIAKSDLAMRPIYHFKKQTIEAHILLCFMALSVCKYMELKTERSTKAIIKLLKQVTDVRLLNTLTNEEVVIRSELSPEIQELLKDLFLSH